MLFGSTIFVLSNNAIKIKHIMKYAIVSRFNPNAMQLQSIGWVLGTPAGEVKPGDHLMWNFGSVYIINAIVSETGKSKTVSTSPINEPGKVFTQRFLKTRLVCRLEK